MKEKMDSNPWMFVSVLLGVLVVVLAGINGLTIYKVLGAGSGGNIIAPSPSPSPQIPPSPTPPSGPVQVNLAGAYAEGPANAKVTIVEYSDFQCPFCLRATPTIEAIQQKYGNDVRLVYKHFPLSFHPNAQPAAEAAECAGEQGKFFEFHDLAFANQESLSDANYKKWAADLKLDTAKFNSCVDTRKYKSKVETQFNEGQQDGVSGTPTFFINGQMLVGAQPQSAFEQLIDPLV